MTHRKMLVALAVAALAGCATQDTPVPEPPPATSPPSASQLTFRWMRSGEPVTGMQVVLMRLERTEKAITDANGRMRRLEGGFDIGKVGDPNDTTYAIDVRPDPQNPREVRVPEPVRLTGRVVSATANARMRLRVGTGMRHPVMTRHRAERVRPYPGVEENVILDGLVLPDVATYWEDVPLAADGTFITRLLTSESDPQLVAFDDAGGMTTHEVRIPQQVALRASLDAGTLSIPAPVALDFQLDLPRTDLPITLMTTLGAASYDPAQRDAVARHLSLLDQFDDAIFEYATGRQAYALELDQPTRIAGLPPFTSVDIDVFGPRPSMGFRRTIQLGRSGPTPVRISAGDLNLPAAADLPPIRGRVVLAGSGTPVANAVVVYSDYPLKREVTTAADGSFTMPQPARPRRALWFVDARASGVPSQYKPTAIVTVPATGVDAQAPVTLELPVQTTDPASQAGTPVAGNGVQQGIFDACQEFGMTTDEQYPACQGAKGGPFASTLGYVKDCGTNSSFTLLQFDIAEGIGEQWELTYAYTPFILFKTGWGVVPETPYIMTMSPVEMPVNRILLRFCADLNCYNQVPATPFQVASYLTDPDTFEGTADNGGNFIINCVNTNPLEIYVNFTVGKEPNVIRYWYDNSARIEYNGTVPIILNRGVPLSAWSEWRKGEQVAGVMR